MTHGIKEIVATLLAIGTAFGCAADSQPQDAPDEVAAVEAALLAGHRYTLPEVTEIVRNAGFAEAEVGPMVCTAWWESSFYERASNQNKNGSTDRGLFQINSIHLGEAGCRISEEQLWNAADNAKCARAVYRSQGLGAWYGYRRHKEECDRF